VGVALLWTVTLLELAAMGLAGLAKFLSPDVWTGMFEGWGYPAWFTFVVGAGEIGGAILLAAPRLATYAAGLLAVIMVGALGTVVVHDSPLGVTAPIAHLVALAIIGAARREGRWRPRG
jgi:uncharacterized membrane protein YphA (DoxX/SURF4 family)